MRRLAPLLLALAACGEDATPLVVARCAADAECGPGFICELGMCAEKSSVSCMSIEGGMAIAQASPPVIDFGKVGLATRFAPVTLRNLGNCTLTVFALDFEGADAAAFECPKCADGLLPIELFPFREQEVELSFTASRPGRFSTELHILSDDPAVPTLRVPVRAEFEGTPEPKLLPAMVDFGYLRQGDRDTQTILVSNHGTGTARLHVTSVALDPPLRAFTLSTSAMPPHPLSPVGAVPTDVFEIGVEYFPRDAADHATELVVVTDQRNGTFRVPIRGTSKTPPRFSVSPMAVAFGDIPLGETRTRTLTIVNQGGSPLELLHRFAATGLNTDFALNPRVIPPIAPGAFVELEVFATPTSRQEIRSLLVFETNDPDRPTTSIMVSATGTDVPALEVVKVEMAFDNSDDSFFGDDLRDVDLTVENPIGQICNEQFAAPMNWGSYGTPQWFAFGRTKEPERIIIPDARVDGTYRVLVQYAEDCASVPTRLVASVLGISISALLGYLTSGAVILDPAQLSEVISMLCLDHDSTQAAITVWVNGRVIGERAVPLGRKGDIAYGLDIVRRNGSASAWTAGSAFTRSSSIGAATQPTAPSSTASPAAVRNA